MLALNPAVAVLRRHGADSEWWAGRGAGRPAADDRGGGLVPHHRRAVRGGQRPAAVPRRRGRQPGGATDADPDADHPAPDGQRRRGADPGGAALQLPAGARGRGQPARLRRRDRRGGRHRRPVGAGQRLRRHPAGVQRRDPARRRGHRGGGVGLDRGDHPDLRRGAAVGRPPHGAALDVLHDHAVPELDPDPLRAARLGRARPRLARRHRRDASPARPRPRAHRPVGRAGEGPPGHRRGLLAGCGSGCW